MSNPEIIVKSKCYVCNILSIMKEVLVEDLAKRCGMKVYDVIKQLEVCKNGVVPLVFKFPKRELTKRKTIFLIVKNLPSTLQVLSKRLNLPKTSVKRYLDKLIEIEVIEPELDMFYLTGIYAKERRSLIRTVMDAWYTKLSEYQVPSVSDPNPVGSAVKLLVRGHPHNAYKREKAEQRKIRKWHRDKAH